MSATKVLIHHLPSVGGGGRVGHLSVLPPFPPQTRKSFQFLKHLKHLLDEIRELLHISPPNFLNFTLLNCNFICRYWINTFKLWKWPCPIIFKCVVWKNKIGGREKLFIILYIQIHILIWLERVALAHACISLQKAKVGWCISKVILISPTYNSNIFPLSPTFWLSKGKIPYNNLMHIYPYAVHKRCAYWIKLMQLSRPLCAKAWGCSNWTAVSKKGEMIN